MFLSFIHVEGTFFLYLCFAENNVQMMYDLVSITQCITMFVSLSFPYKSTMSAPLSI